MKMVSDFNDIRHITTISYVNLSLSSIIDMTVSVNFEGITDFFPYKFYKNNSIEIIIR